MQGHEVQLYAIQLDGALNQYPKVQVLEEKFMPSGGALANPNDKVLVTDLEDKMIEAYGTGWWSSSARRRAARQWTSAGRCSVPNTWARSLRRWSATRSPS